MSFSHSRKICIFLRVVLRAHDCGQKISWRKYASQIIKMLPQGTEFAVFPFLGQETSIDICPPKWKPAGFQESGFTYYFNHVMWRTRKIRVWRLFAGDRKKPFEAFSKPFRSLLEALESLWKMFHWFVIFLLHYIWMWVLNKFSYLSLTVTTWNL